LNWSARRSPVLTLHEDRAYLRQAIDAGVLGYLLKRSAAENFVQAIRAVLVGGLYIDPAIANYMFDSSPKRAGPANSGVPALTDREGEVLRLVALGYTTRRLPAGSTSALNPLRLQIEGGGEARTEDARRTCALRLGRGWLSDI
jgi:hypothetical protein